MARIRYGVEMMGQIATFERLTHAKLHDCFDDHKGFLVFVVQKGEIGKALGKQAKNLKRLSELFKKKIRFVEFNEDMIRFIYNLIKPLKVDNIIQEDDVIVLESEDTKTKGLLIGRDFRNLNALKETVKRYFPITDIKVR